MTSGIPYSVLLGSTVDTRWASVYEASWKNFTQFYVFDTMHTIYELCLPSVRGYGMCMILADPVSSGEYSGIFEFTAPVAELSVVSFTVPLDGWTIAATAAVVTSCSSSADFPAAGVFASRCCVVVVFLSWVLTILFATV